MCAGEYEERGEDSPPNNQYGVIFSELSKKFVQKKEEKRLLQKFVGKVETKVCHFLLCIETFFFNLLRERSARFYGLLQAFLRERDFPAKQ